MPATPFPEPSGYVNLVNDSQFNIINASVKGWTTTATTNDTPIAWILLTIAIIFSIQAIIYYRTKMLTPSALGLLMICLLMDYFNLLSGYVLIAAYVSIVLSIALEVAISIYKKGGT